MHIWGAAERRPRGLEKAPRRNVDAAQTLERIDTWMIDLAFEALGYRNDRQP